MRSGYVGLYDGRFYRAGEVGDRWSRVSRSDTFVYVLSIGSTRVTPSFYNSARWDGFSLRCLYNGNI